MTPKERAEKIFLMRHMFADNRIGQEIIVQKIAFEIEEAQREAVKEFRSMDALQTYQLGIKDGFAAAKKQAAEIARKNACDCCNFDIAAQIENMDVKP